MTTARSFLYCWLLCAGAYSARAVEAQQHRHSDAAPTTQSKLIPIQPDGKPDTNEIGRAFTAPPAPPELTAPVWSTGEFDAGGTVYNLDTLLQVATQHNPTLIQARLHINAQLARAVQAGLYPNPTVSAIGEQIGLNGTAGEWVGAEIEQRFVTGGKLDLSREKYLQRARVAEFNSMAQQYRVCNDIRIRFFNSLAALQILELRRELLKTAEDQVLTMREMYNLGQANQADVQRSLAMIQKHRLAVLGAESHLLRELVELAVMAGLECENVAIEGTLESQQSLIDFETAYRQIIECSPELLAAQAKLREDGVTVNRERVEWVPDIVVSAGPGYNNVDRQTTVGARVALEIPLFDRNQGTIAQAQADYTRQTREIQRLRLDLKRRLAAEYERYISAVQHVTELESVILPAQRETYRLALEGYQRNRAEWPDVLMAQESYTNARIDYVTHLKAQRETETVINGFLLRDGLATPGGPVPSGHIDSVPKPR
ncbi:MAG: TolC family protein [Planctomycetaceae bacterium]